MNIGGSFFFGPPPAKTSEVLMDKLMAASGPSRDLDAAIQEFELVCDPVLNPIEPPPPAPLYTSDMAVAKRFVEHVAPPLWEEVKLYTFALVTPLELVTGCVIWLYAIADAEERS